MYFCTPLVYIIAMCKYLRIRLFVIFTVLTISGFSQPLHTFPHTPKTSLTVASDRYAFWLFIDEAIQNEAPTMSLMVQDIPEGQHYMRVEIDNSVHSTFGQLIQLQYSNNAYWIENQRNMFGISAISNPPRPETIVAFSSMQQNQTYPNAPRHQPQHPRPPHNPQPPFGHPCMNDADFNAALSIIQNETFESSKLSTAKQIVSRNYLNVNQIIEICKLFTFEKDKLDFAKSAYHHCTEKEKYFLLRNVFQFDSSKKELDQYIQQQ